MTTTDGAAVFAYPGAAPGQLEVTVGRCVALARRAAAATGSLRRNTALLHDAWEGAAARACYRELAHVGAVTSTAVRPLREAARVLESYRHAVVWARAEVDRLRAAYDDEVASQRAATALVSGASSVPPQLRRLELADLRAGQQAELAVFHRRYRDIVEGHDDAARLAGRAMSALAAAMIPAAPGCRAPAEREDALVTALPMLHVQRTRLGGGGSGPPPPGTPSQLVVAWWALLTADEQQRLVHDHPAAVGALDGLPGATRSQANELALGELVAGLRSRSGLTDEEAGWLDSAVAVQQALSGARARLDPVTRLPVTAQLLVFDPRAFGGEGRVAISVGDVDTADHVAYLVPGFGASVAESTAGLVGNAARVMQEARRVDLTSSTATVAWLGYDAPGIGAVAGDRAAEAGADLLAADVLAVQAARDLAPHVTVVGHSYGSTTAGAALREDSVGVVGAHDLVLLGSPGPTVETASELNMPEGHVFVGASSRDPLSYADTFGADPTHESFGAVRFQAEDPTRNSWRLDLDDHSKYFNPKTESLHNIARVVVGDYADVRLAAYRAEWPLLPDGINTDPEADREPTVPRR